MSLPRVAPSVGAATRYGLCGRCKRKEHAKCSGFRYDGHAGKVPCLCRHPSHANQEGKQPGKK